MMGLEPTTFCMAMLAMVRVCSQPFAYSVRLQGVPVRLANAPEPDRTPSVAIVAIVPGATNSSINLNRSGKVQAPRNPGSFEAAGRPDVP